MKTRDEIFTEVLVRNNRTTTDGFITDTILKSWYTEANVWANALHKWPFTEGRIQTTYASGGGIGGDEWFFEGYKADSFRILQVGGKRLTKLNFEDYQIMRETQPTATDRVFSDYGRTVFINPYADVSGTVVAYGQYQPYIDVTDENGVTIFSGYDEEGNEAVVEKMTGYLKRREHLANEAELHDQRAVQKLEEVYKRIMDEQYAYQPSPTRDGWFKRFDVINGRGLDQDNLNNINQF